MSAITKLLTPGGGGVSITPASSIASDVTVNVPSVDCTLASDENGALYPLKSGTAVASTSGTSIDFTGIPSWVKRITMMFVGVSSNGSARWIVRLGTSGGIATTDYLGAGAYAGGTNVCGGENNATGFAILNGGAAQVMHGTMTFCLLNSSTNTWVASGTFGDSSQAYCFFSGGSTSLSGACATVRLTTGNGTDTFDAGSINIMYE